MIKKLNIVNYGSYRNFEWERFCDKEFSHRNIIYGRNYSGKTTLSRILRSIERRESHEDFEEGKFNLRLENNVQIDETMLSESDIKIRVYNSDFKKDNLSILHDKNGEVEPFTILGEENIQINELIEKAQDNKKIYSEKLGAETEENSLLGKKKLLEDGLRKLNRNLKNKKSSKASDINGNNELFMRTEAKKQYNINDLKKDIESAHVLDSNEKNESKGILKDDVKPLISFNIADYEMKPLYEIIKESEKLIKREIKPSNSIEYLLEDSELQDWVRLGSELHRDKRETCAFCESELPDNIWLRLDNHFTKESEEYKYELEQVVKKINIELTEWNNLSLIDENQVYTIFKEKLRTNHREWEVLKQKQIGSLIEIKNVLESRLSDIFSTTIQSMENIVDYYDEIVISLKKHLEIINENNDYSSNLLAEQEIARRRLRLDSISNFLETVDYQVKVKEIKEKKNNLDYAIKEISNVELEIEKIEREINEWESEINDEEKAVKQINEYLSKYIGHPELSLVVEESIENENEKKMKFAIKRKNEYAKNLSEGEQSLIAFCYFLASLKNISSPEEYIVFIDDPISSLDGNNLFYIYSLIDSEVAGNNYKQVFISTHSLNLLKYLQRLSKPSGNVKWHNKLFLIENKIKSDGNPFSVIKELPNYMKKYATEFTFLFHQLCTVATEEQTDENYHVFYNFPNNARKFLETYLFFRYPNHKLSNDKRLKEFFNQDMNSVSFINRINNEYSHGENQPDRLASPIDIPEFKQDAKILLMKISQHDLVQFESLCTSVGVSREELLDSLMVDYTPITP